MVLNIFFIAMFWIFQFISHSSYSGISQEEYLEQIKRHREALENMKNYKEKQKAYNEIFKPMLDKSNKKTDQVILHVICGFSSNDISEDHKFFGQAILHFQNATKITKTLSHSDKKEIIDVIERNGFINFKRATAMIYGYNNYVKKELALGDENAEKVKIQLQGWCGFYKELLTFIYELSKPLKDCGECEQCNNCPFLKFKFVFFNFRTILGEDLFYSKFGFVKEAAEVVQKMAWCIENAHDEVFHRKKTECR